MFDKNHPSRDDRTGSASPRSGRRTNPTAGRRSEKKIVPGSDVEENLKSLTKTRTAGDADDDQIVFTDLTPTRLEQELTAIETPAGDDIIRQWMDDQGLRLRKIRKVIPGGEAILRIEPFRRAMKWVDFEYEPPTTASE